MLDWVDLIIRIGVGVGPVLDDPELLDYIQRKLLKTLHAKLKQTNNPWDDALVRADTQSRDVDRPVTGAAYERPIVVLEDVPHEKLRSSGVDRREGQRDRRPAVHETPERTIRRRQELVVAAGRREPRSELAIDRRSANSDMFCKPERKTSQSKPRSATCRSRSV